MQAKLKDRWHAFEVEEFPPACLGRTVNGMLYEQVDAVAAACISTFLKKGELDDECRALLDDALIRLELMAGAVEEAHQPYFTRLLALARETRQAVGDKAR